MVGENVTVKNLLKLEDVLNEKQLHRVIEQSLTDQSNWKISHTEIRSATDGLAGFLGDHLRATLHVMVNGSTEKIQLFIKRVPCGNKPKAEFIEANNFFKREQMMFQLIEEMKAANDSNPWCAKALIYTKLLLVMQDLSEQGYSTRPTLETFDLPHVRIIASTIARYHADLANYQTKRSIDENHHWTFMEQYRDILQEPTFKDSPWIRCAAKLTSNFLKIFSNKYNNIPNIESKLTELYIEGCNSFKEYSNTLNVLNHKDLWANNIMFRYEKGVPCNALLIDFQCLRYGPPAFDLTLLLYCTTSRCFRKQYENEIFRHYYSVFSEQLEDYTKEKLEHLGYDEKEFLCWCEKSRMFGLVFAITVFPYVLMEPRTAQRNFDDPETYDKYLNDDRTEPVLAHCYENAEYMSRQLDVCEEFVERYVLNLN
ncbi:uncharacterized protein LOC128201203 [Galleria mellonella]|uniref:Uncharacterized protein LOC128201203 n=1 Tax=Galleria mellonella TaxID=7137 RepID=A0ABM3MPV2_GALME|nr:uncharacterized protein LOC128201203 [Galleria mellonella]